MRQYERPMSRSTPLQAKSLPASPASASDDRTAVPKSPGTWKSVVKAEPLADLPLASEATRVSPPSVSPKVPPRRSLASAVPGWSLKAPKKRPERPSEAVQAAAVPEAKRLRVATALHPPAEYVDKDAHSVWSNLESPTALRALRPSPSGEGCHQAPPFFPSHPAYPTEPASSHHLRAPPRYEPLPPQWDGLPSKAQAGAWQPAHVRQE